MLTIFRLEVKDSQFLVTHDSQAFYCEEDAKAAAEAIWQSKRAFRRIGGLAFKRAELEPVVRAFDGDGNAYTIRPMTLEGEMK